MKKIIICLLLSITTVVVIIVIGGVLLTKGLSDFDLKKHDTREVSFEDDGTILSGTLVMPRDVSKPFIALIIHGDGAQDRFTDGGALPLINTLVDAGIGVFSWDKAGVNKSTGNWLDQTMSDRAGEAMEARKAISELDDINVDQIGFLGFSQAGWVLPRIANQTSPAFTVLVGGAVSWRNQGTYHNRVEMMSEGVAQDEIEQRLADRLERNDIIFKTPFDPMQTTDMDPARFRFVAGAYWEDSTSIISGMKGPVLAIWGEEDLNVDAQSNSEIFKKQLMPLAENRRVVIVPKATHGLLRADFFNYQSQSDWPWYLNPVFLSMGRDAFAEQSFDLITDWIKAFAAPSV